VSPSPQSTAASPRGAPGLAPERPSAAAGQVSDAPLLETRALTVRAAGRALVERLDWRVHAGERWCVIGRNGAGKSLVLRALAGLGVPGREGEVLWRGRAQHEWPVGTAATLRALMPQQAQDRFALTVERTLALSEVAGSPTLRVSELMTALDIGSLASRRADQLSGGERQRVALAQCAVQGAALMLLDEPVSFQDPAHQQVVGRWLVEAVPAQGGRQAWVASAHDPSWIARVATHVLALVGDGRWRAGPVDQILSAPVLEQTYGCAWRSVEGAWLPA